MKPPGSIRSSGSSWLEGLGLRISWAGRPASCPPAPVRGAKSSLGFLTPASFQKTKFLDPRRPFCSKKLQFLNPRHPSRFKKLQFLNPRHPSRFKKLKFLNPRHPSRFKKLGFLYFKTPISFQKTSVSESETPIWIPKISFSYPRRPSRFKNYQFLDPKTPSASTLRRQGSAPPRIQASMLARSGRIQRSGQERHLVTEPAHQRLGTVELVPEVAKSGVARGDVGHGGQLVGGHAHEVGRVGEPEPSAPYEEAVVAARALDRQDWAARRLTR